MCEQLHDYIVNDPICLVNECPKRCRCRLGYFFVIFPDFYKGFTDDDSGFTFPLV